MENEYTKVQIELMRALNEGKKSVEEKGWLSEEEVLAYFQKKSDEKQNQSENLRKH